MEKIKEIVYVSLNEWEGIYIDDEIKGQNHSLRINDLPMNEPFILKYLNYNKKIDDFVMEEGFLREKLSDYPPELIKFKR
jgi:hypothetical protein